MQSSVLYSLEAKPDTTLILLGMEKDCSNDALYCGK
jgi:hypothetical protein